MTLDTYLALFSAMFIVAIVPGPAVFAISSTAMVGGFRRGAFMTVGILCADYIFILFAVSGLSHLAQLMGSTFIAVKYLCAAYLIWIGAKLLLSKPNASNMNMLPKTRKLDVLSGFLITMSNPKAILFYLALFPAFVSFEDITNYDLLGMLVCATLAFGSVNLGYSYLFSKAKTKVLSSHKRQGMFNKLAGAVLSVTGIIIVVRN
ncbi:MULTISPECIES: LysE family translocator [Pseudoalteromonas]|uniref:Lysine transporter LysE n=1 Tax=Pseudoalteromonas amylolytica TaxID=1859457 RepID=A0A1S1MUE1_9GAMM|nr:MULTISPECIES: LysE family translocator [Pseudoalteromonas]OHU87710.1 hypothetical protein BFC16_09780 [Pseudoalteromonas sp. JW3]OHU91152.1 hypothetical protein BET10_09900 [Pseudoalteromonas amylolytica]